MNCIAHRGFAGVNPENTLPAVRDAVDRTDAVEIDVRRCGSGELVVCHDETVGRTTDGSGPVADYTANELAALSVEGSAAGVPLFADVVETIPSGVTLHAELKERGLGAEVGAILSASSVDAVVSSFDPGALTELADFPTAIAVSVVDNTLQQAVSLGCTAIHPRQTIVDARFVDQAHDAGLAVNAWTVTDPEETRRLRDSGVDGVITDFPSCCPSSV